MATPEQIAANRANAQKSTGPRTDEGKLHASQNALRHGLCAAIPEMHDEGDQGHDHVLVALREEFQPVGPNEEILVYKMAEHFCYAKRASYLLSEQLDSNDGGDDNAREIGLFMRYHAQSDRGYYRALTELRKTQKERRCPHVQPDAVTYPSAGSEIPPLILPTSHVQPGDIGQDRSIGSVSSTPDTAAEVTQPPSNAQPDAAAYPSGEQCATDRDRSIGFVSPKAPPQPASPTRVAPESLVSAPCAPLQTPTTDRIETQKAA
jgi:hypothetical protein